MSEKESELKKDYKTGFCLSINQSVMDKVDILTARVKEKNPKMTRSSVITLLLKERLEEYNL